MQKTGNILYENRDHGFQSGAKKMGDALLKKNKFMILILTVMILAFAGVGCSSGKTAEDQKSSLTEEVESYRGYTRVVEQEEYDFYSYFIERDMTGEISQEELDEKIRSYINEVNAVFYLGNKLDLCEPYSFELLKLRMEQENDARKVKLEQGEAVYGLQEFQLETYFQYVYSNLETDIRAYMEQNADEEILEQAEEYYNANRETFRVRESVTYEITTGGNTESATADREQLNFFGKSDRGLADFLEIAEIGDTYEDVQNGEAREICVTDIGYSEEGMESNKDAIVSQYILEEFYPAMIETVAKNNPVEFELN